MHIQNRTAGVAILFRYVNFKVWKMTRDKQGTLYMKMKQPQIHI